MESWERCRFTERQLLVDVAEEHGLSTEAAEHLTRFSGGRAFDEPVRFAGRDMLAETAEELADAANYVRWETVRLKAEGEDTTGLSVVLAKVLAAYADLHNLQESRCAETV